MRIKNAILALAFGVFISACENDDNGGGEPLPTGDYVDGILVSNEGPFNNGTGTVTFISDDLETKEDNIFNTVNNEDLGNIVQSIGFSEDKAYVIANVSNKITVVDRFTFEKEAGITTGLNNPRYFVSANGKGYVTNWGDAADETDDYVAIIDLQTNTVEDTIPVAFGPEKITVKGSFVYVAHQGGFGQNNIISIIDSDVNSVSKTITVGDVPNSMQFDIDGNLWVLCGGKPSFTGEETAGLLFKVNTTTNESFGSLGFTGTQHPSHLSRSGSDFYYNLNGEVYKLSDTATSLPAASEFSGLSIYAMTTLDDKLYVTDAKDFASDGEIQRYNADTGAFMDAFTVKVAPNGNCFFGE